MNQDKKHLATIHTISSIDQYWHVRTKTDKATQFHFELVRLTHTGAKTYKISEKDQPNKVKIK